MINDINKPIIRIEKLTVKNNTNDALKNINVSIDPGEIVSIIGANGAGKTTLLYSINKLSIPYEGDVVVFQKNINNSKYSVLRDIRSRIGFIYQSDYLVQNLSVLSNVLHGCLGKKNNVLNWYSKISDKKSIEKAMYYLNLVGVARFYKRKIFTLSGGEKKRVSIARTLMQETEIILADEPTSNLDIETGRSIMSTIKAISKSNNVTVLYSTHNVSYSINYSDRIIGLKKGELVIDSESKSISMKELLNLYL
jgi:phosphonate transport system ATP-binding protein